MFNTVSSSYTYLAELQHPKNFSRILSKYVYSLVLTNKLQQQHLFKVFQQLYGLAMLHPLAQGGLEVRTALTTCSHDEINHLLYKIHFSTINDLSRHVSMWFNACCPNIKPEFYTINDLSRHVSMWLMLPEHQATLCQWVQHGHP